MFRLTVLSANNINIYFLVFKSSQIYLFWILNIKALKVNLRYYIKEWQMQIANRHVFYV